jgi:hypothetical protein
MLYQGFVNGGNAATVPKTRADVQLEARIITKLEALRDRTVIGAPALSYRGGSIELTTEEHALLRRYIDRAQWRTEMAPDVVRLWEWLG